MANEKIVNREGLKAFRQAFQGKLENGQIQPARAKNLAPLSDESGTTQDTPFILQGTGTANGTDSVDTADIGKHLEKQGNSVCVNQLVQNGNFASSGGWSSVGGSISVSNNKGTFTADNNLTSNSRIQTDIAFISNHKYLIRYYITCSKAISTGVKAGSQTAFLYNKSISANTKTLVEIIATSSTTGSQTTYFYCNQNSGLSIGDTVDYEFVNVIDLTLWFGSNAHIPADLISHPEKAPLYGITSDLAYNTGTLTDCAGRYLECGQSRNVWDEESEIGGINTTTGQNDNGVSDRLRSTNYILVIPNSKYYFKTITGATYGTVYFYDKNKNYLYYIGSAGNSIIDIPNNCQYVRLSLGPGYGTTYNHNVTFSLYYSPEEGGEDYDKYYPYVAPKVYDTGTEVLRSVGSIRDYKTPDGVVHRLVGSYTFTGEESWNYNSTNDVFYLSMSGKAYGLTNIRSGVYATRTTSGGSGNWQLEDGTIGGGSNNANIYIKDSSLNGNTTSLKTKLGTSSINYGLATPSTEQGTSFIEEIEINDYGTMGWLDTNNDYVSIPQGCKIFYPVDYLLLIDTLNGYVNGSVENLAKKTDFVFATNTEIDGLFE